MSVTNQPRRRMMHARTSFPDECPTYNAGRLSVPAKLARSFADSVSQRGQRPGDVIATHMRKVIAQGELDDAWPSAKAEKVPAFSVELSPETNRILEVESFHYDATPAFFVARLLGAVQRRRQRIHAKKESILQ